MISIFKKKDLIINLLRYKENKTLQDVQLYKLIDFGRIRVVVVALHHPIFRLVCVLRDFFLHSILFEVISQLRHVLF